MWIENKSNYESNESNNSTFKRDLNALKREIEWMKEKDYKTYLLFSNFEARLGGQSEQTAYEYAETRTLISKLDSWEIKAEELKQERWVENIYSVLYDIEENVNMLIYWFTREEIEEYSNTNNLDNKYKVIKWLYDYGLDKDLLETVLSWEDAKRYSALEIEYKEAYTKFYQLAEEMVNSNQSISPEVEKEIASLENKWKELGKLRSQIADSIVRMYYPESDDNIQNTISKFSEVSDKLSDFYTTHEALHINETIRHSVDMLYQWVPEDITKAFFNDYLIYKWDTDRYEWLDSSIIEHLENGLTLEEATEIENLEDKKKNLNESEEERYEYLRKKDRLWLRMQVKYNNWDLKEYLEKYATEGEINKFERTLREWKEISKVLNENEISTLWEWKYTVITDSVIEEAIKSWIELAKLKNTFIDRIMKEKLIAKLDIKKAKDKKVLEDVINNLSKNPSLKNKEELKDVYLKVAEWNKNWSDLNPIEQELYNAVEKWIQNHFDKRIPIYIPFWPNA